MSIPFCRFSPALLSTSPSWSLHTLAIPELSPRKQTNRQRGRGVATVANRPSPGHLSPPRALNDVMAPLADSGETQEPWKRRGVMQEPPRDHAPAPQLGSFRPCTYSPVPTAPLLPKSVSKLSYKPSHSLEAGVTFICITFGVDSILLLFTIHPSLMVCKYDDRRSQGESGFLGVP